MKSTRLASLAVVVALVVAASAQNKPGQIKGGFYVYGAAGKSCRAWVSERSGPEGAANHQWVLGYVTAYGVDLAWRVSSGGNASGTLRRTNTEEIGQIIDKYCGDRHPDSDLWRAADDLILQLGGARPTPPPSMPIREYR